MRLPGSKLGVALATLCLLNGLPAAAQPASPESAAAAKQPEQGAAPKGDANPATEAAVGERPPVGPSLREADPICVALTKAAGENGLSADFFVRLIWQESRFNPKAVSHKGAQGIAQFMPSTANWRGLDDPFEPAQALHESARWLRELHEEFGNPGLAAAAYNAGPGRVREWLAGRRTLPSETRAFVRIITGLQAEEWMNKRGPEQPSLAGGAPIDCRELKALFARRAVPKGTRVAKAEQTADTAPRLPWGLQLVGHWSEMKALSDYRMLQARFPGILGDRQPLVLRTRLPGRGPAGWVRIRVAEPTRERAQALCGRLKGAGGNCLVMKN